MSKEAGLDVVALLGEAERIAGDRRQVLALPSFGFESRVERRQALVLGGACSPSMLRRTPGTDVYHDRIPYTSTVANPRLLFVERLGGGELEPWVAFLESLVKEGRGLLAACADVDERSQLSATILVNHERGALSAGLARLPGRETARELAQRVAAAAGASSDQLYLAAGAGPPKPQYLPAAAKAYVRRDTCLVIPPPGQDWSEVTDTIAVVLIGGGDAEEQQARLFEAAEHLHAGD